MIEILLGVMRSGKTSLAKKKKGYIFICTDKKINELGSNFQRFYEYVLSVIKPDKNYVFDGWFSYNTDMQTILNLKRDTGQEVVITVLYVPKAILMKRDKRNDSKWVEWSLKFLIELYKGLNTIPFTFREMKNNVLYPLKFSKGKEISVDEYMIKVKSDISNANKEDVENFVRTLAEQENYDRYYQDIPLPYGLSIKGYERSTLSFGIISRNVNFRGQTVLDIGCYHGYSTFGAENAGAVEVTGLDRDDRVLNTTRWIGRIWGYKANFVCAGIDDYTIPKKYDIIMCLNMIHHTDRPKDVIEKIFKLGNMIILEADDNFKGMADKIKTHELAKSLDGPRTPDLKRKIFIYKRVNV
jgi:2-polyprenyl-3-methyl-5-hydroxy-6-metoxy-1,4-benzoquinol methylase